MDHIVFNRPGKSANYYAADGSVFHFEASGDTWGRYGASDDGNPPQPPYGHCCPLAPGHYEIGAVNDNGADYPPEGHYQINVLDLSDDTKEALIKAGKCTADVANGTLNIGGVVLARGGIAAHRREGIMIHGGGSNLGSHALDPMQTLLRTWGCTRVHNADLEKLVELVNKAHAAGSHIIFSCIGDPAPVDG